MRYRVVDPHTGRELRSYPTLSSAELRARVERSERAFRDWERTSFAERAAVLREVARRLRADADEHARLMAEEMGKPVRQGRGEAEKCAWACEYYAEHAERFLADEPAETEATKSYVAYRPLGPVLAIMPWNFPYWQVFRFAAPALMAGNTVLLKHAPNVPGCAERIERLLADAGLPEGVFQSVFVTNQQAGAVIRNRRVRAVTLTGSVNAGRSVARQAGAQVKKTVLELGGSDPYLILEDADVEHAAAKCVESRLVNSGQSCIAAKRFIVVEAVRERFTEALVEGMRAARVGDPRDEATTVGPQAREDLRDKLHEQVRGSVAKGARLLLGGEPAPRDGWYYPPSVLANVRKGTPAYAEEVFGPVASILPVRDRRTAVRVANDSAFGLGAAVFTADVAEGERIAREELRAGCCFVNDYVRSDPRLPFGGVMDSGYGRELGVHGIREFVNVKTVYVA
ncbi:MAG TPA: NAD-dependent succinate-semialdehyde dehydrogenase [Longimicrobiales bacterium]|nr:NAD-dependent succinate-semialdehyde dehydrogenase [Longimicrobiales bacterium]